MKVRQVCSEDFFAIQSIKNSLSKESFKKHLVNQDRGKVEFLTVDVEGSLVCYVVLKWHGKPTHSKYPDLEDLHTKKSERGRGYASFLIEKCEEIARSKGFSKLGMAVNIDHNHPARKLYKKLGYKHDGKPQYVDGIYDGVEDWCVDLEKRLK